MAALSEQLRAFELPGKVALAAVLFSLYLAALAVYRLYLHPLAKFPGPKLAAVTSWYEAYYEIALTGQYWKQISLLHDQYGMFVRFLPYGCGPGKLVRHKPWLTCLKAPLSVSRRTSSISETRASSTTSTLRTCISTRRAGTSALGVRIPS
jgi:hypothetical protein